MHVITLASAKGGVGKSTIAIGLAVTAANAGESVFILDADPQASCVTWADLRPHDTPGVDRVRPDELEGAIDTLRAARYSTIFIDTQGADSAGSSIAIRLADLVLVPCRPFLLDIASVRQTQDVISRLGKLYAITLNAVTPRVSARVADAAEALGGLVSPSLANRYAIPDAFAHGLAPCEVEPEGAAAQEFRELWTYVRGRLPQ